MSKRPDGEEVAISELILAEFYGLPRNSAVLTMTSQGVTEFATGNVKDFEGLGFRKVGNSLTA